MIIRFSEIDMSVLHASRASIIAVLCLVSSACGGADGSRVDYTSGKPKGKWFADSMENATPVQEMTDPASPDAGEPTERSKTTATEAAQGGASADAKGVRAGDGAAGSAGAQAARPSTGGSRALESAGGASAPSAQVTLSFTTVTQHMGKGNTSCGKGEDGMSYGPCNLGAVWVTTPDGKLVKIVSVWGKSTYTKHLVRYHADRAGMRPDVMTGATLKMNEAHEVTWDHTDMMKQTVPRGAFKLIVEVADADTMSVPNGMNALLELSFDTERRTQVKVTDMAYYTNIELRYE
jgi:hypothetical protein